MSSREPMWYCHECGAEMRPLMVPDPVCASCHGSFVEKIEDPANDPRQFHSGGGPGDGGDDDGFDNFLIGLQTLLNRGMMQQQQQQRGTTEQPSQRSQPRSSMTFQFRTSSGQGPRQTSISWGTSSPSGSPNPGAVPTMSEFLRSGPSAGPNNDTENRGGTRISGPLFAQYLLSLLGQTDHPLLPLFVGGMPESGRMGDYVFSQEALDQIITQIMESSNAHRPVPATEEIIQKLPREVLVEKSPLLSRDCAVCKDQFQLGTEDPDEQIIVTLPCKHPFHQPCILPWLKSSGTCPVCRHALVPQPDQNALPNGPTASSSSRLPFGSGGNPFNTVNNSSTSRARSQSPIGHRSSRSEGGSSDPYRGGTSAGIFTQLFRNLGSPAHGGSPSSSSATPSPTQSASAPSPTFPPSTSPTTSSGFASGPTRAQDSTRRHAHRSSMDSSVPFVPRRHSPQPQSHSSTGYRFGSSYTSRDEQQRQNQRQNSDGGRGGSGRSTDNGRPHVPGQWSDDMMDLD